MVICLYLCNPPCLVGFLVLHLHVWHEESGQGEGSEVCTEHCTIYALHLHICYALYTSHRGWEASFLIRFFGLSGELSTKVGFAFSNNDLKSQDLRFRMKKKKTCWTMFYDFRFCLGIVTTHLTYQCPKSLFYMEKTQYLSKGRVKKNSKLSTFCE